MAFGLDSVLGASFLVYILVQNLSQFEFTPILGDWKAARARIGFLAVWGMISFLAQLDKIRFQAAKAIIICRAMREMMRFWAAMGMTD